MCDKPKIYTGCAMRGGKENLKRSYLKSEGELNWGLVIIYLWNQGVDSIHDIRAMNTDATSYQYKPPE